MKKDEFNKLIEGIKKRNEERRKRKEEKMRKLAEEARLKKQNTASFYNAPSAVGVSFSGKKPVKEYRMPSDTMSVRGPMRAKSPYRESNLSKKLLDNLPTELGNEIDSGNFDDGETSVAFEELMGEVAKYEMNSGLSKDIETLLKKK